jgi:hypothetical protein
MSTLNDLAARAFRQYLDAASARHARPSPRSNFPPDGDVRLTLNIAAALRAKLRHAAIERGIRAGELVERLIEAHL